jgi:hypothetical protein
MSEIDVFASLLFEEAKRFFEKANLEKTSAGKTAYLHASLLLSISSLEAHINAIADEVLLRTDIPMFDKSILAEKDIVINRGKLELKNNLKIQRILERFEFIHNTFGFKAINYDEKWWAQLNNALSTRNNLVHPKDKLEIDEKLVQQSLEGVLGALNSLYLSLYKTKYPALGRRLHSSMDF